MRYAETDKMGVVYHANYFMWFEVGRCELLRAIGRSYREMEAEGIGLPVIEAHCEYKSPARYDDELQVKTTGQAAVAGAGRVRVRNQPAGDGTVNAIGRTVHAAIDTTGRPCRLPDYIRELLRMKALVTGAAGFIGSHLSAALLDAGASVTGIDCFTDYYPRPLKEANLATVRDRPGFTFVEAALQDIDLKPLLAGVTHVFHLAAQAGVRKSWGRDFDVYTKNNVEATQRLLEALVGVPIQKYVYASSSSVYGDDVPLPMREDTYLQPLSPYGVSKLAAEHLGQLYWANHGVPGRLAAVFHGVRSSSAAGYGIPALSDGGEGRQAHYRLR